MLVMMWAAAWPLAKTGAAGPTGSNNPFVDDYLIYAVVLIVLASLSAGRTWGIGDRWARLPIVLSQDPEAVRRLEETVAMLDAAVTHIRLVALGLTANDE